MAKEFNSKIKLKAFDGVSQVLDKIRGKFPKLNTAVKTSSFAFAQMQRQTKKLREELSAVGNGIKSLGSAMTVGVTLPVLAATGFSIKAFADYETALVGVGKTTGLAGSELKNFGDRIIDLTKTIPVSATELMTLGQTAAQLGVSGSDNILKFSSTLAKLSTASNIVGEEGASDLARLMTVTRSSMGDVDRFAAAIVALGNTSAATEAEILGFATRLGGATAVFNVSGVDALGMATAMKSLGIEAEAGSSSVQRAFGAINESISGGGKKFAALSQITGISADQLKKRFAEDSVGVFNEFVVGLNKISQAGGDVTQALDFFGMSGVRDIQVIGTLAKNSDLLAQKLKTSADGFRENTALENEFSAQLGTLNNQISLTQNEIFATAKDIGETFKPAILAALSAVKSFMGFLRNNPALTKMMVAFALLAAAIGPVIFAIGAFITILPALMTGITFISSGLFALKLAAIGVSIPFLILIAKFLLIGAAIAGVIALIWVFKDAIMNGIVFAFDWVIAKVDSLLEKLFGLKNALGKLTGSTDRNTQRNDNGVRLAPGGGVLMPQGAPTGAMESAAQFNTDFMTQTNNARVQVDVRAPLSTTVKGESENGVLTLNRGLAGVF